MYEKPNIYGASGDSHPLKWDAEWAMKRRDGMTNPKAEVAALKSLEESAQTALRDAESGDKTRLAQIAASLRGDLEAVKAARQPKP